MPSGFCFNEFIFGKGLRNHVHYPISLYLGSDKALKPWLLSEAGSTLVSHYSCP